METKGAPCQKQNPTLPYLPFPTLPYATLTTLLYPTLKIPYKP